MPKVEDKSIANLEGLNVKTKAFLDDKKNKSLMNKTITGGDGKKVTMLQAYMSACRTRGPFDAFENLDPALRNLAANRQMCNLEEQIKDAKSPEEFSQWLIENDYLHNPALRLGIANASLQNTSFGNKANDFFKQVDGHLNEKVFRDTLAPMTKDDKEKYVSSFGADKKTAEANIKRHEESQKVMLKVLFMGQMGKSQIYDNKEPSQWTNSVSDMFLSGQRAGIILPGVQGKGKDKDAARQSIVDSIYGKNQGEEAGNKKRSAATHSIGLKSFNLKEKFKEIKLSIRNAYWGVRTNQFGMDIAAGGLGKKGVGGIIQNDGTCGHMYSRIEKGDDSHYGGLLIGFESEAPKKSNRLGHHHGASATPEKASCFGTQKDATVGDKYGGREIDLSGLNTDDFKFTIARFDRYITQNQKDLTSDDQLKRQAAEKNLTDLSRQLSGKPMTMAEKKQFFDEKLQLPHNSLVDGKTVAQQAEELTSEIASRLSKKTVEAKTEIKVESIAREAAAAGAAGIAEDAPSTSIAASNPDMNKKQKESVTFDDLNKSAEKPKPKTRPVPPPRTEKKSEVQKANSM